MKIDPRFLGMWIGIGFVLLCLFYLGSRTYKPDPVMAPADAQDAAQETVVVSLDTMVVEATPSAKDASTEANDALPNLHSLYGRKIINIDSILGKHTGFHFAVVEISKKSGSIYPYRVVWRPEAFEKSLPSFDCGFFPNSDADFLVSYCKGGDIPEDKGRVLMPLLFLKSNQDLFMKCGQFKIPGLRKAK